MRIKIVLSVLAPAQEPAIVPTPNGDPNTIVPLTLPPELFINRFDPQGHARLLSQWAWTFCKS